MEIRYMYFPSVEEPECVAVLVEQNLIGDPEAKLDYLKKMETSFPGFPVLLVTKIDTSSEVYGPPHLAQALASKVLEGIHWEMIDAK